MEREGGVAKRRRAQGQGAGVDGVSAVTRRGFIAIGGLGAAAVLAPRAAVGSEPVAVSVPVVQEDLMLVQGGCTCPLDADGRPLGASWPGWEGRG